MPGRPATASKLFGEAAAVLLGDAHGGTMEIARPGVVAQSRPEMEHLIERRRGERADIGKALHESLVVGDYRRDLSLLQHDLRHPDAIGRAAALPGEVVPPVASMPVDERCCEVAPARAFDNVGHSTGNLSAVAVRTRALPRRRVDWSAGMRRDCRLHRLAPVGIGGGAPSRVIEVGPRARRKARRGLQLRAVQYQLAIFDAGHGGIPRHRRELAVRSWVPARHRWVAHRDPPAAARRMR